MFRDCKGKVHRSALFIEQSTEINGKIDKLSKELRQITRLEQEDRSDR